MSALHNSLIKYVTLRRALGAKFYAPALALDHFIKFLERKGAQFITTKLALSWATQPQQVQRATWAQRLCTVRRFAAWMSAEDPRNEVPPRGLIEARYRRTKPYIFSLQEIEQLMLEAFRLPSPTGLRALTYKTLIGLLASTGLRPGEARALEIHDVDLTNGILAIRKTKFDKSRFVPVDDSTCAALVHYAKRRDELCPCRDTEAFLVSECGTRLGRSIASHTFAKLSSLIGLRPVVEGRCVGRGPRLIDFRHSFATWRLVVWYRAGLDVEREMPKLSTYLGHVSVANTYWYIEAVPELLRLATDRLIVEHSGGAR